MIRLGICDQNKSKEKRIQRCGPNMFLVRWAKDLEELDVCDIELCFPDTSNIGEFIARFHVVDPLSFWYRARFDFSVSVSNDYPYSPPKVRALQKIYHPNIDYEGNISLNILSPSCWIPLFSINIVFFGLIHLFSEPNFIDNINSHASSTFQADPSIFKTTVDITLSGGQIDNQQFSKINLITLS